MTLENKPQLLIEDFTNQSLSPLVGRLNNFTTKSYINEFEETKKYSPDRGSPHSEKSKSKSPVCNRTDSYRMAILTSSRPTLK